MNKRWKELWDMSKTSGVHPEFGEYDMYSAEKFTELIVKECADVAADHEALDIYEEIREHFGVKW